MAAAAALVAAFVFGGGAVAAGAADAPDAASEPKEAAAALEKLVFEDSTGTWGAVADADTAEDVPFSIRVSVPGDVLSQNRVLCRIVDELPQGMELDPESVRITSGNEELTELFACELRDNVLTLEADLAESTLEGDSEIDVDYTAHLTAASPVGGGGSVNSAHLELETDNGSFVTPAARTAVLTYRLILTKVDAANHSRPLSGARFVLGRKDGLFAVVRDGSIAGWTRSQTEATRLTSDAEGHISISGLDTGTYALTEVEAPSGYQGLLETTEFEIRSTLSFDVASGRGRIDSLEIASDGAASPGDTATATVYCLVENAQQPNRIVPTTGDSTRDVWPLAALGAAVSGGALCLRKRMRRERSSKHRPAHMAAGLLVAALCFFNHAACSPLRALAQDVEAEPLVLGTGADAAADDTEAFDIDSSTLGVLAGKTRSGTTMLRGTVTEPVTTVAGEADIPRSTTNSYINILNMSWENAYVMVNDTTDFACSVYSPTNTYINCSFGSGNYAGAMGQAISSMVLYKGTPGAFGAGTDVWGIDTVSDTTGKGLVAIWFKDAGVLSDTGESVSMLLKLDQYQIMPNYIDYYNYMSGGSALETTSTYRQYRNAGYSNVPLLYVFKSVGLDQTDPSNALVWMNSVWCSSQTWSVSFYRSSQVPSGYNANTGYSMGTLDLSDGLAVSAATNGESYLARHYCYDLDIAGIRWLDADGTYNSSSPYNNSGNSLFAQGGAYFTKAGAESFAWASGVTGSRYISSSSNLKNDAVGGLTYWLHDSDKTAGGIQTGNRWQSYGGEDHNTDWRNALAADILPASSFVWVGTECSSGINLNSQFTGTGSLKVTKSTNDGSAQAFPFKITLESPEYSTGTLSWRELDGSFDYSIVDGQGTAVSSGSLQSGGNVSLSAGQTLVVNDIPEGTRFTVAETSHAGYGPVLVTSTETIAGDEFAGTIMNGITSELDIVNKKLLAPASWSILKQGDSGEPLAGAEFTVKYFAGSPSGTPTRSWVIRSDAQGHASLDAAHLVSGDNFYLDGNVVGLPLGTVTIEETAAPSGYVRDETVRTFEIRDTGGALESTIPNEIVIENARLVGSLEVSKQVRGTGASSNRGFSFSLRITHDGEPLSGTFGGETFVDGVAVFSLKANQTKTFTGIPAGSTYELSEESAPGYTVSWQNKTGEIATGETAKAVATNTYAASGSVQLRLKKVLDSDGPALKDGQFTFDLHESTPDGAVVSSTACAADGSVSFELSYDQSDIGHSYSYYVTEKNDGQRGVEYDTHVARVDVAVNDNGDGTLDIDVSYDGEVFTNVYRSYVLPETGLGGIAGSVALGVSLVGGAALALTGKRRIARP